MVDFPIKQFGTAVAITLGENLIYRRLDGRRTIYRRHGSVFHSLVALRNGMRPIIGGHHGSGIYSWIDRVVSHHGLFDLRAALAGEILIYCPPDPYRFRSNASPG